MLPCKATIVLAIAALAACVVLAAQGRRRDYEAFKCSQANIAPAAIAGAAASAGLTSTELLGAAVAMGTATALGIALGEESKKKKAAEEAAAASPGGGGGPAPGPKQEPTTCPASIKNPRGVHYPYQSVPDKAGKLKCCVDTARKTCIDVVNNGGSIILPPVNTVVNPSGPSPTSPLQWKQWTRPQPDNLERIRYNTIVISAFHKIFDKSECGMYNFSWLLRCRDHTIERAETATGFHWRFKVTIRYPCPGPAKDGVYPNPQRYMVGQFAVEAFTKKGDDWPKSMFLHVAENVKVQQLSKTEEAGGKDGWGETCL